LKKLFGILLVFGLLTGCAGEEYDNDEEYEEGYDYDDDGEYETDCDSSDDYNIDGECQPVESMSPEEIEAELLEFMED
jgi:hypothetical protein